MGFGDYRKEKRFPSRLEAFEFLNDLAEKEILSEDVSATLLDIADVIRRELSNIDFWGCKTENEFMLTVARREPLDDDSEEYKKEYVEWISFINGIDRYKMSARSGAFGYDEDEEDVWEDVED